MNIPLIILGISFIAFCISWIWKGYKKQQRRSGLCKAILDAMNNDYQTYKVTFDPKTMRFTIERAKNNTKININVLDKYEEKQ